MFTEEPWKDQRSELTHFLKKVRKMLTLLKNLKLSEE